MEVSQAAADLIPRIRELDTLAGEQLADEMLLLKKGLLENPDAVALMFPEDIGLMVIALRKITGQSIAEATKEKVKGKPKSKALTQQEMADAFDEL